MNPAGHQLPYIDRRDIERAQDEETRRLNLAQGQYDVSFRDGPYNPLRSPFLQPAAEAGGYALYLDWVHGAGAPPMSAVIKRRFRNAHPGTVGAEQSGQPAFGAVLHARSLTMRLRSRRGARSQRRYSMPPTPASSLHPGTHET